VRILFLMEYFYEDQVGGSEVQAFLVARELARLGHDVHYVCMRLGDGVPRETSVSGVRVHRWLPRRTILKGLLGPCVVRAVRRIKPDVVYQRFASSLTGLGALAARRHGAGFVWGCSEDSTAVPKWFTRSTDAHLSTYRGGLLKSAALWVDARVNQALFEYGVRNADAVVAQSEHQRALFRSGWGIDAALVRNGVDVSPVRSRKTGETPVVLWLARVSKGKRPELFIEMVSRLQGHSAHFILAGGRADDAYGSEIAAAAGAVEALQVVGEVPLDEANALIASADIFVSTSWGEGFPNTFLQAWTHGVPVVSLEVDPDGVIASEDLGFVVSSVDELTGAVVRLLSDPALRTEIGERAVTYVKKSHDITCVAVQYEQLFEGVLGETRAAR
jgi:glycosyltransferase involved in cell wall biosynthesis